MNKPHGMSRKDYRNMKEIVREFLNDPNAPVNHFDEACEGYHSERHDEGYSSRSVVVSLPFKGDTSGTYEVLVNDRSRDCDGPLSSENNYIVGRRGKRNRFYISGRNWETNRPQGKFNVNGNWKVLEKRFSSRRDYTAESMGY